MRELVVLDLDNTCICAKEMDELKDVVDPESYEYEDLEDLYRVFPRPGLQEFLDNLFRNYEVAVWTAADLDYALFVIDNFITCNKPERELQFIMWSDHCEYSVEKTEDEQAKQLTLLEPLYPTKQLVLIDDNEDVLRQTCDTIDSQFFDVCNKKQAKNDLFFPKTCMDLIKAHFKKSSRDDVKCRIRNRLKELLLPHT